MSHAVLSIALLVGFGAALFCSCGLISYVLKVRSSKSQRIHTQPQDGYSVALSGVDPIPDVGYYHHPAALEECGSHLSHLCEASPEVLTGAIESSGELVNGVLESSGEVIGSLVEGALQ